jgi:hypothetical protein
MTPIYDRKRMRELYDAGCNDREIARQMGCATTTPKEWRRSQNLPPVTPVRAHNSLTPTILLLLAIGRPDSAIAEIVKTSTAYVRAVRRRQRPGVVQRESALAYRRHLEAIGRAS